MARVRGYGRRSDDDQSTFSPQAQERAVRAWSDANGHTFAGWYFDDDVSGKRSDREDFQRLLTDACADPASIVVVHKVDRLARDTELILNRHKRLLKAHVKLVSVSEPVDFDTPFGKVILTQIASLGQFHVDNLAPEVQKGLREKWERGGHNGYVPFGYVRRHQFDTKGERIRGTEEIVQTEDRHVVELIRDKYLTGSYSDASLMEELNAAGYTFLDPRTNTRVRFQRDTIGGILTNYFYCGYVQYKGEWRQGKHEPLWTEAEYEQIQAIRRRRSWPGAGAKTNSVKQALLTEMIYCAACSHKLYYQPREKGGGYYFCGGKRRYGQEFCASTNVVGHRADGDVLQLFTGLALPPEMRAAVIDELRRRLHVPNPNPLIPTTKIREQLRRLDVAYRAGAEDLDDATYLAERERLTARLNEVPSEDVQRRMLDVALAEQLLADLPALIAEASRTHKRALIQQLIERFWFRDRAVVAITPTPQGHVILEALAVAVRYNDGVISAGSTE